MIKRLYVDNYTCLVNFEYQPVRLQLLFGENGTGKSAVFDVLARLRDFLVWGKPTGEMFPPSTLTAWQTRPEQTFELEVEGNGGVYRYRLVIEHNRALNISRVRQEQLRFEGNLLYDFDGQNAHLFNDDFSKGPVFPQDGSRSGAAFVPERADHRLLAWFRHRLGMTYVIAIDPLRMDLASLGERTAPDPGLTNFASWYRHLTQDSPEKMGALFDSLQQVIDGFTGLKLGAAGETARVLRVYFKHREEQDTAGREFSLMLNQISTGHRCLIALFTILHCAVRPDMTLCIDEPDNFIALREMQPWLTELCDRVEEEKSQCLVISHHPEFIDLLAVKHGVRFTRTGQGPVRLKAFQWSQADAVRPSEIVARGWDE
ncbi:MAG TPA: ATP-binding protein [Phycisphaerae bacterium]|nr:ATP-binding protein [Phycisphaerae bacterium]